MSPHSTPSANLARAFAMARYAEPELACAPRATHLSSPLMIGSKETDFDGSRPLAGMLLAASIAALLVVADQVIDTWSDGHLLAGWVALWTLAFAAIAFLASPLRQMAGLLARRFLRGIAGMRQAQAEARMWELASYDPRVLEEIRAAMARHAD